MTNKLKNRNEIFIKNDNWIIMFQLGKNENEFNLWFSKELRDLVYHAITCIEKKELYGGIIFRD